MRGNHTVLLGFLGNFLCRLIQGQRWAQSRFGLIPRLWRRLLGRGPKGIPAAQLRNSLVRVPAQVMFERLRACRSLHGLVNIKRSGAQLAILNGCCPWWLRVFLLPDQKQLLSIGSYLLNESVTELWSRGPAVSFEIILSRNCGSTAWVCCDWRTC